MRETVLEFRRRAQRLERLAGPRADWAHRGPVEVAHALDAMGAVSTGFSRVLDLVDEMAGGYIPAGLTDVARGYRVGVTDDPGRCSGVPLGAYKGAAIVAWAVDA